MIRGGHKCDPVEPVVVSVHGADAPDGQAFITALKKALGYSYMVRTLDDHTGAHAFGECPDIVFEPSAPPTGRRRELRILLGIGGGATAADADADAEITVLDPLHPDAPLRTAEVLASLPNLRSIGGLGTRQPPLDLQCVELSEYPDPEAVFEELYGLSSHRVWLDSSNPATDAVGGRNRFSIMADDSGRHGMRARHENGVTTVESDLTATRIHGPFFTWLDRVWGSATGQAPGLPLNWGSPLAGSVISAMSSNANVAATQCSHPCRTLRSSGAHVLWCSTTGHGMYIYWRKRGRRASNGARMLPDASGAYPTRPGPWSVACRPCGSAQPIPPSPILRRSLRPRAKSHRGTPTRSA